MGYHHFSVGDRVEVVDGSPYKQIPKGSMGTIHSIYQSNCRIAIDGKTNKASSYGHFYFKYNQIKHVNEGSTTIMEGNYRIVEVLFIEGNNTGKSYPYACYDPTIEIGDICVVKTGHHGYSLAKVHEILTSTDEEVTREIVCKADFSEYNKRVENRKRMAELKALMNARAKQLQDVALFKMLAESDPDMANMLAEYEQRLNG